MSIREIGVKSIEKRYWQRSIAWPRNGVGGTKGGVTITPNIDNDCEYLALWSDGKVISQEKRASCWAYPRAALAYQKFPIMNMGVVFRLMNQAQMETDLVNRPGYQTTLSRSCNFQELR